MKTCLLPELNESSIKKYIFKQVCKTFILSNLGGIPLIVYLVKVIAADDEKDDGEDGDEDV